MTLSLLSLLQFLNVLLKNYLLAPVGRWQYSTLQVLPLFILTEKSHTSTMLDQSHLFEGLYTLQCAWYVSVCKCVHK